MNAKLLFIMIGFVLQSRSSGDRGSRADVWFTVFYFDKLPTGYQVSNAGTDVFFFYFVFLCALGLGAIPV